jgi:hypothetical protein
MNMKERIARRVFIIIGTISICLAVLGVGYNACYLSADYSDILISGETPFFYAAFFTMSAICILCYSILLLVGIRMVRLQSRAVTILCAVLGFEVAYTLVEPLVAINISDSRISMSIAAATGVANGGLMFQYVVLFPLWAIPLAWWARKYVPQPNLSN